MSRRTALVTGASRGIGAATALRLARDGLDVVIHYNENAKKAQDVVQAVGALGVKAVLVQADLGVPASVDALVQHVHSEVAGIDVLVNNAGVYPRAFMHETSAADWKRTMDVNVGGMFQVTQALVPYMVEQEWGRIVNLSSVLGLRGSRHGAAYAASKAAVLGFTKSVAHELAPHGITVNAVAPGAIETDILSSDTPRQRAKRVKTIPMGRVGAPEDVAAAVSFLARDDAGYVTGHTLHVNGGFLMM